MAEPRENLSDRCPRCAAPRMDVSPSDVPIPSALARYACGAVYLAFADPRQGPACIGYCVEPLHRPVSSEVPVETDDLDLVPEDFELDLLTRADLEHSYERLRDNCAYYAEALRGRIRSLQLRIEDATVHFETALVLSDRAPDDVTSLVRLLDLHVYSLENALLAGRIGVDETLDDLQDARPIQKTPPDLILTTYPELARVLRQSKAIDAFGRLYDGDFDRAARSFGDLIDGGTIDDDSLAMCYVGLAACEHNRGEADLAVEKLSDAALAAQAASYTLNRARAAAALLGAYAFLGRTQDADDWRSFVRNLSCPDATKSAFLERGAWIQERSEELSRLVVF